MGGVLQPALSETLVAQQAELERTRAALAEAEAALSNGSRLSFLAGGGVVPDVLAAQQAELERTRAKLSEAEAAIARGSERRDKPADDNDVAVSRAMIAQQAQLENVRARAAEAEAVLQAKIGELDTTRHENASLRARMAALEEGAQGLDGDRGARVEGGNNGEMSSLAAWAQSVDPGHANELLQDNHLV
eukprot:CAMPEP_0175936020 /NCGR_PEP_ID=MMETSP0108-20121206/21387_1 /TAXON_ID=195067 ORGANISM="Goniomonas pacifica, Strain CCMP1869" /NCGR_SAMPLE_ID=MMETSP0108 /ASSEMBLY_ACC=CAM_ASM_000204 /LENGTH=189 /DNA_ID=CAMNT_0017260071 /DNA_START=83 /DNA_END=652 /DNA_ORIENTATION=+